MLILNLNEVAGFNASNWRTKVNLGGVRYRINPAGVQAIKLAVTILWMTEHKRSLFSLRRDLRAMRKSRCRAALTHLIEVTTNDRLRLIAIWMRGQCGGYLGTEVLAKLSVVDAEAVRLKVARAMQRMSGWSVLERMSVCDPSLRVRRLASSREPSEFHSRLRDYVNKSTSLPVVAKDTAPGRELYVATDFEFAKRMAPKSVEYIREVLDRIRFLVRGRIEVGKASNATSASSLPN